MSQMIYVHQLLWGYLFSTINGLRRLETAIYWLPTILYIYAAVGILVIALSLNKFSQDDVADSSHSRTNGLSHLV